MFYRRDERESGFSDTLTRNMDVECGGNRIHGCVPCLHLRPSLRHAHSKLLLLLPSLNSSLNHTHPPCPCPPRSRSALVYFLFKPQVSKPLHPASSSSQFHAFRLISSKTPSSCSDPTSTLDTRSVCDVSFLRLSLSLSQLQLAGQVSAG
jgi:hypothetical protein